MKNIDETRSGDRKYPSNGRPAGRELHESGQCLMSSKRNYKNHVLRGHVPYDGRCDSCVLGRMQNIRFKSTRKKGDLDRIQELRPFDKIFCDMFDVGAQSKGGRRWALVMVDEASRFVNVYTMRTKDEAWKGLGTLLLMHKVPRGAVIFSDGGTEFRGKFETLCRERGLLRRVSVRYQPQFNGVAEREIREVCGMIRTNLVHAFGEKGEISTEGLSLWAECANYCAYVRNRTPHSALKGRCPVDVIHGDGTAAKELAEVKAAFGEHGYYYVQPNVRTPGKFAMRARRCQFMGIDERTRSMRVLDKMARAEVVHTRKAVFKGDLLSEDNVGQRRGKAPRNADGSENGLWVPEIAYDEYPGEFGVEVDDLDGQRQTGPAHEEGQRTEVERPQVIHEVDEIQESDEGQEAEDERDPEEGIEAEDERSQEEGQEAEAVSNEAVSSKPVRKKRERDLMSLMLWALSGTIFMRLRARLRSSTRVRMCMKDRRRDLLGR